MKHHTNRNSLILRNFTFGVEDSLSSTVGLLSGIAAAQINRSAIVVTGLILIFTEALSMAVGSFLSDESVEELEHKREQPLSQSLPMAAVMFFSYFLSGLIPIAPYVLADYPVSVWISVSFTLASLLGLGFINARLSNTSPARHALRMLILGGSVAGLGVLVGFFLKNLTF